MEYEILGHNGSSALSATSVTERPIEECWRVIAAPEGRVTMCAIYQPLLGGLQLRVVCKPGHVLRVATVVDLEAARAMATEWLVAARQSGEV